MLDNNAERWNEVLDVCDHAETLSGDNHLSSSFNGRPRETPSTGLTHKPRREQLSYLPYVRERPERVKTTRSKDCGA